MGETTGIAWTDHTLNPWIGCAKVSPGCAHCYAEHSTPTRKARAAGLELWGTDAARSETKGWIANVRRWDRAAERDGVRRRVFVASLADVFEAHDDLPPVRAALFRMLESCQALDFQVLTKRPQNILRMVPESWREAWPAHVWIGTTCEDQARADERIPHLLRVPASVRFLSVEPQIGPVRLPLSDLEGGLGIQWVICGGESGPRARPFNIAWARSLRDQCKASGVPFFMKQLGARPFYLNGSVEAFPMRLADSHGGDESEWPPDLRGCRAFPVRG